MKNIILKSCLIALCLICGLGNAWGEDYELVTTAPTDWSGSYLFAYVNGTSAYVYNGTDSGANNGVSATISSNKISSASGMAVIEVASVTGGYSLKVVGGTNNGKYLSGGTKNGTTFNTSAVANSLSMNTDGTVKINNNTSTSFQFNSASDQQRFRYFTSAQKGVKLFKKVENVTPKTYTVTFNAGTNGTCSTSSLTETSAGAGVTLPSCTANTNYTFVGWSTSSNPTSADAGIAGANYKPSSDCTLYAYYTYQAPSHTAHFSINGTINDAYDCTVTEGSAITFPTGLADINGKKFVGWMEGTISGTADKAPDFVTSATMGTADITYNAVYATQTGSGEAQTTLVNSTDGLVAGNTYYIAASATYAGTTVVMGKSAGGNNFPATAFSAEPLALTLGGNATDGWTFSYTDGGFTYYLDPTNTTSNNYLKRNTSVTEYGKFSISFSSDAAVITSKGKTSRNILRYNSPSTCFSCYSSGQSPVYLFTEGGTTYSDYCTTVPTSGPTDASWSVEPASVSVEVGKTATATISTDYDGTLSVSSNATGTATATISDKTITVTGVAAGTTTLTVTGTATSNFNAISKTIDVTVTASSATTPAFAYFEETATINVGEILEAKDYCGTIASDAGFDDYSISTAVCSAIGAADGQKISDDYACIYSKVSFKKAGTYVVHVTAPAVAGKYTASEGYITVTVTGPTLYKVTIETPVNGTLIVKHGDDTVNSGDEFEEGEKLQITATPDADYKFRNWQAYDGTTHTFTTSFEWEMSAHDVTLTANFDEIQDYTIAWSVNGQIVKIETLEEGTEVVPVLSTDDLFTAAVPAGVTKVFTGWVTTPTVDANATPSYVTPAATATKDVTYYAVFATEEEGTGSVDKTAAFNVANYADANNWTNATAYSFAETEELRIDEGHTATTATNNGKYYTTDETWRFYKSEGGSFTVTSLKGDMKSITITFVPKDSSKKWPKLIHNEVEAASGEQITDISGNTAVFSVGGDGGNIGIQNIEVVYVGTGGTTYSDFTTLPYLQLNEANTSIVELADAPCDKVEVTRALKAGNWNTFCLPFSLNEEEIESQLGSDAEVKALSTFDVNDEGTTLILNFGDASEIAAGQPYMVRVQEAVSTITAEGKTINTVTAPVQEFSNELYNCNFHGNYYYLEGTKNGYVPHSTFIISNNLFYLVNSNVKMKGFRGYIEATEKATGAPVKAMSFTTDAVVTGTIGIQYEGLEDGCIYNLQGLRQSKLQKGINIVNGKKVLR